jgi:hypothetical protein
MNESPFLQLLDFKPKEEVELSDHRHLEFPSHEFTKILAHFEISRAKDNIMNINLTNEEFFVDYLCEKSVVHSTNLESRFNEKIPEPLIPCPRSLLESVQRLVQPIDMVRICSIFKTGGCST